MSLITISEISRDMNISTRTLRYYEQIGLIESTKKDDYVYRTYDEAAVMRLQQIVVLRKLRIPLKAIGVILQSEDATEIIQVFRQNLSEIDEEVTALSTIRDIINNFILCLNESTRQDIKLNLLDDTVLLEAVDALTVQKRQLKEEKTAADLERASEKLSKLSDRDVRIMYLPPTMVASIPLVGNSPEDRASVLLREFVQKNDLMNIKPDFRHYGFNHPNGNNDDDHGYEFWVTIPDDFDVLPPFTKKVFDGGLYAAHTIVFGDFEEWNWLWTWVENNEDFDFRLGDPECMDGLIEEHLNYFNQYNLKSFDSDRFQMELMIPVKEKISP